MMFDALDKMSDAVDMSDTKVGKAIDLLAWVDDNKEGLERKIDEGIDIGHQAVMWIKLLAAVGIALVVAIVV